MSHVFWEEPFGACNSFKLNSTMFSASQYVGLRGLVKLKRIKKSEKNPDWSDPTHPPHPSPPSQLFIFLGIFGNMRTTHKKKKYKSKLGFDPPTHFFNLTKPLNHHEGHRSGHITKSALGWICLLDNWRYISAKSKKPKQQYQLT